MVKIMSCPSYAYLKSLWYPLDPRALLDAVTNIKKIHICWKQPQFSVYPLGSVLSELSWLIISGCDAPRSLLCVGYSVTRKFREASIDVHCTVSVQVPG
jgi:hypothetical protein